MKKALIITGGEFSLIENLSYDYVIACDKGTEYARRMQIVPNVIIGDFDSLDGDVKDLFPEIEVLTFPIEKDDTDTMLAIKHALSKGYMDITIICALGNRLDHTIANLQSLHYIARHNGIGKIISEKEQLLTLSLQNRSIELSDKEGYSLSLFSLSDSCKGLTIKGAKYELENGTLENSFPLGLGNSFKDSTVHISFTEGELLIIQSKM